VAGGAALVIGADQTLELDDGTILGKPGSRDDALAQLRALSGRTHQLHSAAVIAERGERIWGETESVRLRVRSLGEDFLQAYLDRDYEAVRWNAGSYRVEGLGAQLFEQIDGSHFAVLGLPLLPLLAFLRARGEIRS
jgi:septum formation protein